MDYNGYNLVQDSTYGYRRLDPIPSSEELAVFYESQYYNELRKGGRAPELRRLMEGGPEGERERQWLRDGLYTDILELMQSNTPGKRMLEVGCGPGEFLAFARERDYQVVGIEPSIEAAAHAQTNGLMVHATTLEEFSRQAPSGENDKFDVVVMLNVLEHVPDPVATVQRCRSQLNPRGVLCIRVPNDFTEIQQAAKTQLGKPEWWIAIPDHINYFNFESLCRLLNGTGFEIAHAQGDFPMEMFLLMGDDYVGVPDVGSRCHERRVRFDLGLMPCLRRRIYCALAGVGVGRDCLVFGKLRTP
jgi:2-polyprenyl-3-methyl-5-hydroxy-6-metoxy-1,4-benzoquinol methylase